MDGVDDEVESEAQDCVAFLLDLVEVAVPYAEIDEKENDTMEIDLEDEDTNSVFSGIRRSYSNTNKRPYPIDESEIESVKSNAPSSSRTSFTGSKKVVQNKINSEGIEPEKEDLTMIVKPGLNTIISVLRDINSKDCCVCNSPKVVYQAIRGGKIERLCSQECMNIYKKIRTNPPCLECKQPLQMGSYAFKPSFGLISGVLCSEICLQKYEALRTPKTRCVNATCLKHIDSSKGTFHWQTMDFCSAKCVNDVMLKVGAKCAECRANVNFKSIGKYSVRFGQLVRQFCNVACLTKYKKSIRSCFFCQCEIGPNNASLASQQTIDRDFGEGIKSFCNMRCLEDFLKFDTQKKMNLETSCSPELKSGDICDICSCFHVTDNPGNISIDHINFTDGDEPLFLCSKTCIAAYRYKKGTNNLFCYHCYSLDWNINSGVMLRFGNNCRPFCTKRCMNLFIMKIRKLVNCYCCKCCKYQFDLIEETSAKSDCEAIDNETTDRSKYYCSLVCLNLIQESKAIVSKSGSSFDFIKCGFCLKITKGLIHVKNASIPNSHNPFIRSFCSHACYNSYQKAEMQQRIQASRDLLKQRMLQQHTQKSQQPLRPVNSQLQEKIAIVGNEVTSGPLVSSSQRMTNGTLTVANSGHSDATQVRPPQSTVSPQQPSQVGQKTVSQVLPRKQQILSTAAVNGVILVKQVKMLDAEVQCSKNLVTKATMCKPHLIDASVQTDPM
jgi:hypothetical protein